MRNWGLAIAAILGILFALLYLKGCVSDQSKPVIKEYLTTEVAAEIKHSRAAQDTIIAKADTLQAVNKKLPRIKDLRPKYRRDTVYVKDTVWITETSNCDSLYKVAIHKEMLLDSTFELINDLKFTIVKERGLQSRKDSINEVEKDSLRTEVKSLVRKVKAEKIKGNAKGIGGVILGWLLGSAVLAR